MKIIKNFDLNAKKGKAVPLHAVKVYGAIEV